MPLGKGALRLLVLHCVGEGLVPVDRQRAVAGTSGGEGTRPHCAGRAEGDGDELSEACVKE
jgi:hypothetical protein